MAKLDPTDDHKMINLEISAKNMNSLHQNLWVAQTILNLHNKHPLRNESDNNDTFDVLEILIRDSFKMLTESINY